MGRVKRMERFDIINELISTRGYTRYLELGCYKDATFDRVECETKVGVDKEQGGTHRMTTSGFFEQNEDEFDIIFIDADHHHDAVMRDVENALECLAPGGVIVLHDCYPKDLLHESPGGCGTVWRALVKLRGRPDLDLIVGDFDHGTTLLRRGENGHLVDVATPMDDLTYGDLEANRTEWLCPRSITTIRAWIASWPEDV